MQDTDVTRYNRANVVCFLRLDLTIMQGGRMRQSKIPIHNTKSNEVNDDWYLKTAYQDELSISLKL